MSTVLNQAVEGQAEIVEEVDPLTVELPNPEGDATEDLAEAQETGTEAQETVQEAALGRMKAGEFAKAAGVSLEEFYRDIVFDVGEGEEASLSQILDNAKSLKDAQEALLRERTELKRQAETAATQMPQGQYSPEVMQLMAQSRAYMQALQTTDWSQIDPAEAANQKFDLQNQANLLAAQAQAKQVEWQGKMQARMQQVKAEADRITRSKVPEWNEPTTFTRDWRELGDVMNGYGISPAELDSIVDPRFRHALHDFLQLKRQGAKIQAGAQKVRKISKTLGQGARGQQADAAQMTPEQVRKAIKKAPTERERAKLRMTLPLPE